ncbi:10290_t:CDS:1, partial [Scutellospora calospora]
QILRCDINIKALSRSQKSKITGTSLQIMKTCPQITHQLDISFNNITNFNDTFDKLAKNLKPDQRIITINFENNTKSNCKELKEDTLHISRNILQKESSQIQSKKKNRLLFYLNTKN